MNIRYFEKVLYLYPEIQGVVYWNAQQDGTPWDDPYDGLVWENIEIVKPTKQELDALDEEVVRVELNKRNETLRKRIRDEKSSSDHSILSGLHVVNKGREVEMTLTEYLDFLEEKQKGK